jgi:hypothetical protein
MDTVKEALLHELYEAREAHRRMTGDLRFRGVEGPAAETARTVRVLVDRLWDHVHSGSRNSTRAVLNYEVASNMPASFGAVELPAHPSGLVLAEQHL